MSSNQNGEPLTYELDCLVRAKGMIQQMFEAIDRVSDEGTKRSLTLSMADIADQVSDAACGVRRHLGLPEPEDE